MLSEYLLLSFLFTIRQKDLLKCLAFMGSLYSCPGLLLTSEWVSKSEWKLLLTCIFIYVKKFSKFWVQYQWGSATKIACKLEQTKITLNSQSIFSNIKQCKTYTWVTRGGAKYSPKNSPNYSPVISGNLVTSIGNAISYAFSSAGTFNFSSAGTFNFSSTGTFLYLNVISYAFSSTGTFNLS